MLPSSVQNILEKGKQKCRTLGKSIEENMNKVGSSDVSGRRGGSGGGFIGLFKRFWYWLAVYIIGSKWNVIEIFSRHKVLNIEAMPKRKGEIAVITGGARGIGVEVVRKLLRLDMHVIIGCRNQESGKKMLDNLKEEGEVTGTAECFTLDLLSLSSVQEFANKILMKGKPIHILINNAGIMFVPYQLTGDGFEQHFQVNYLSHFLLTYLLLPRMASAGTEERASRVVNVSSCAHFGGSINFSDLQMEKMYSPHMAYMASKLMQVTSSNDFDARCKSIGAKVRCYSLHPGVVGTDLYEQIWWAQAFKFCLSWFFKTPAQGSDTICYAALSPEVESEGGIFFCNSTKESPNRKANDVGAQQKLWEISCELANVDKILSLNSPLQSKTSSSQSSEQQ